MRFIKAVIAFLDEEKLRFSHANLSNLVELRFMCIITIIHFNRCETN